MDTLSIGNRGFDMKPVQFLMPLFLATASANADPLTIASWNIANLGAPGSELRDFNRMASDYDRIREIISDLAADVIAFQEIGSKAALEAVLPDGYAYHFETRCYDNASKCNADENDIYTAIAIRVALPHAFFQIDEMAIQHLNECCSPARQVRGGVGVDVTAEGRRYLIPSIHLKAACKDNSVEPGTEDDCATQREQVRLLRSWMDKQDDDATIVLAGDFNRKLLGRSDKIRSEFFSNIAQEHILPSADVRDCWSSFHFDFDRLREEAIANNPRFEAEGKLPWIFTPLSSTEIDFFVVENLPDGRTIDADQIELLGDYVFRDPGEALTHCDGSLRTFKGNKVLTFAESYPSDHCPIVMSIAE